MISCQRLMGTWLVARATVDHLLYHDAVTTGRNWTAYLAENVKDLEDYIAARLSSPAMAARVDLFCKRARRRPHRSICRWQPHASTVVRSRRFWALASEDAKCRLQL